MYAGTQCHGVTCPLLMMMMNGLYCENAAFTSLTIVPGPWQLDRPSDRARGMTLRNTASEKATWRLQGKPGLNLEFDHLQNDMKTTYLLSPTGLVNAMSYAPSSPRGMMRMENPFQDGMSPLSFRGRATRLSPLSRSDG